MGKYVIAQEQSIVAAVLLIRMLEFEKSMFIVPTAILEDIASGGVLPVGSDA